LLDGVIHVVNNDSAVNRTAARYVKNLERGPLLMASKALKGLTIKFGADTSELTKSLDKVEKQGKSLSSELGQINKLLKLDPKNTELLAQKQKVLADAIGNTEKKLDTLKEAEKQVQKQFERGEVSEAQYRALQREIIETENKLSRYKNAAKETADAVEELGREAGEAAGKIDDQADKTEEAEKATEDFDDAAGDLAKGGLAALVAAATAAVTAIVALAEESREYRTEMAKLNTAFQDNSFSAETATRTYEALQSVLGETEQAVEASNNLAALCTSEEELNDWTEILTGAYAKFGASLPVEGLAEAANETKRVGQVTGPLADALNWAAEEGERFGVTMKEATEENEEWNKAVEEATSAEDYFNLALQECSTEQERQQLITQTLTKLYGSAAKQYKKTNAEVIRANQATEKWNKATAKLGKTVEPVVTDIKELGVTLLEDASEPLEDTADFIRKEVIPAIKSISSWTAKNLPKIKAGLVGVAAAMVAFKAASIATTVAQKGLKGAIAATTVAQKALTLAQAATPWGLVATAIAGVTAAMMAYGVSVAKAERGVDVLTQEEKDLMTAADEAAEAFREQKKATDEALADTTAQMGHVQDMANELRQLAAASGEVQEKDQARAQFILTELNEALGTEYTMVDGVIQKYDDLQNSIDGVIQAKLANSLLDAANDSYVQAIMDESAAFENLGLKQKDYQAQLKKTQDAEQAYYDLQAQALEARDNARTADEFRALQYYSTLISEAYGAWQEEKGILAGKETAYNDALNHYGVVKDTILNYEDAQTAALQGNYQTTVDILSKKGGAYGNYSSKVNKETAKVLDTLLKEAVDAGIKAEQTKRNFENGVDGYTKEMVEEAEKGYNDAMEEFANAYADAESVGEDLAEGMTDGAENKRSVLMAKARSLVAGFLSAAREEADTHSPSKKTIKIFEDIGEGAVVGTENKTKDVERAATKQTAAVLEAYRAPEIDAQRALRNIADQQVARQAAGQMTAATANSGALEAILATLKEGQVLLLDSGAVVGGTAKKMDSQLGMLRVLAARGAR